MPAVRSAIARYGVRCAPRLREPWDVARMKLRKRKGIASVFYGGDESPSAHVMRSKRRKRLFGFCWMHLRGTSGSGHGCRAPTENRKAEKALPLPAACAGRRRRERGELHLDGTHWRCWNLRAQLSSLGGITERDSRKASGQFWPRVWPRVWPGPARMGPELQRANDSDARDGRGGKCSRT